MGNNRLKESMKSLWINHMDTEKDEQQKWMKIGNTFSPKIAQPQQQQPHTPLQYYWRLLDQQTSVERTTTQARNYHPPSGSLLSSQQHQLPSRKTHTKVKRILKLIKSINEGNKEVNQNKKSKLIQLVEDFHKQYQSLYGRYNNLKESVQNKVNDDNKKSSSSSSSASEDSYQGDLNNQKSEMPKVDPPNQKRLTIDGLNNYDSEGLYLDEASEVVKEALNVEPVSSSYPVHGMEGEVNKTEKLVDESGLLKQRLVEKEKEVFSLTTVNHVLEKEIGSKGDENLGLKTLVSKLKAREVEYNADLKNFKQNKKESMAKLDEATKKAEDLQVEVDSLLAQKHDIEEQLLAANRKGMTQVKSLMDEIKGLQQELILLASQKNKKEGELEKKSQEMLGCVMQIENLKQCQEALNLRVKDLEMELEKKSQEMSGFVMQIESLKIQLDIKDINEKEIKDSLNLRVKDLEVEMSSLTSAKSDLEENLKSIIDEANQSKVEKAELYARIFGLDGKIREKESEVLQLQKKLEVYENENKSFKQKLDMLKSEKSFTQLQIEKERQEYSYSITRLQELNNELTNKIIKKEKVLEEQEDIMKKLSQEHKQVQRNFLDSKLNLKVVERKMEEMTEEFRKKFEDNIRLLSRRICVSEQLQAECRDWYKNTQEKFEQDHRINQEAFKKIKALSVETSEMLVGLDTMGLKFGEFCEHFMNRISKVSREVHFVKKWVERKNKAIKIVKEEFDYVIRQLNIKEEDILGLRQKVWKLENKVREFEKVTKEKEEGMLVLEEEKREAIRQLCVWIDYHRGRYDFVRKTLMEVTSRNQTRLV